MGDRGNTMGPGPGGSTAGRSVDDISAARRRLAALYRRAICREYRVTAEQLMGRGRDVLLAEARQVWYYVLRADLGLSVTQTAHLVGRDHSTVLHGSARIAAQAETPRLAAALAGVRATYLALDWQGVQEAEVARRAIPRVRRQCPAVEQVQAERMPPPWRYDPLSLYWRRELRRRERSLSYRTGAAQW